MQQNHRQSNIYSKQGYSLIELMVAMLIGLFLIAAMLTIYLGSKKSYAAQQEFLTLEDTGRNALYELTRIIQHAGYRTANLYPIGSYFITTQPTAASCSGSGVNSTSSNIASVSAITTVSDGAGADTIGVVYIGDSQLNEDCSGATLPADCQIGAAISSDSARIYSSFDITTDANGVPALTCHGSLQAGALTLVKGVEKMQFLYGVDEDMDGQVDNYMNATMVSSESAWNHVINVQVAILVRTLKEVRETPVAQSYVLLDKKIDISADRYHREVFTSLIRLPNTKS